MTVQVLVGDCREQLQTLADNSVHCVVTSPPYWGLREYMGDVGMIGCESSFEEHRSNLVDAFREVRRVLRHDGTLWLNYGDSYCGSNRGTGDYERREHEAHRVGRHNLNPAGDLGLKPKDLMLMPYRIASALQEDGWYLRSDIVWHKPNPSPESVRDRPTSAHEHIFLFANSRRYFYDHGAVATRLKRSTKARLNQKTFDSQTGGEKDPKTGNRSFRKIAKNLKSRIDKQSGHGRRLEGFNERWGDNELSEDIVNLRNVWRFSTANYKGAHFATFPPELVERCIRAGTSEFGVCESCHAPYVREIAKSDAPHVADSNTKYDQTTSKAGRIARLRDTARAEGQEYSQSVQTLTWKPQCDCAADSVPAVVLDPFGGAGTVALVAQRLNRNSILIEVSDEYAQLAHDRIETDNEDYPLFGNALEHP